MDYFDKTREERMAHVDLETDCIPGSWKSRVGKCHQARRSLEKFLETKKPISRDWQTCHLCDCDSNAPVPCINPLHIYFGTASENWFDKSKQTRKKQVSDWVSSGQYEWSCIHCGTAGKGAGNLKRWHGDACRMK